jgi:hypothetical protein
MAEVPQAMVVHPVVHQVTALVAMEALALATVAPVTEALAMAVRAMVALEAPVVMEATIDRQA